MKDSENSCKTCKYLSKDNICRYDEKHLIKVPNIEVFTCKHHRDSKKDKTC